MDEHGSPVAVPEAVLGLDNVPLELPVASIGPRILAATADYLLLATIAGAVTVAVIAAAVATGIGFGWGVAVWALVMFCLNTGFFAVLEVAMAGQTPGKRLLKLRVVTADGGTPATGALVLRNLLRVVDNLVGVVLIAVDPLARRLGDRLAGTLVVHAAPPRAEVVLGRVPVGWGAHHVALVEAFLDRSATLEPERADALARRILLLVERADPGFLAVVAELAGPVARVHAAFRGERA
jgi:uncharacterized RDD family membrane protein YckC